jgi:hypothetical protein
MLSNTEKEKIIAKYRKLLAMTRSPNVAEADTAAKMAEEYRISHNIREKIKTEILYPQKPNAPSPVSWFDEYGRRHWDGENNWKKEPNEFDATTAFDDVESDEERMERLELKRRKEDADYFQQLWYLMREGFEEVN